AVAPGGAGPGGSLGAGRRRRGRGAVRAPARGTREPARGTAELRPPWESSGTDDLPWPVPGSSASRSSPRPRPRPTSLRERDESDPERRAVELAQRGRIILDVSIADLEAAEAVHGAFHPIAWPCRSAGSEPGRGGRRPRPVPGRSPGGAAPRRPPLVIMPLGEDRTGRALTRAILIVIAGRTYCLQRVSGTELAPVQWRLTRPHPP